MACLSKSYIVNQLITGTIFDKNLYHMKSVLSLSLQLLFDIFLNPRSIQQYIITHLHMHSCKLLILLSSGK